VDPVRISHTVKKNMLKENGMYEKQDEEASDVKLLSKDMEVNFSAKQDDEEEMLDVPVLEKEALDDTEVAVADAKIPEKGKILEEQKQTDVKRQGTLKQTPGRSKLQANTTVEPKVAPSAKKEIKQQPATQPTPKPITVP
jgi:hypothetical protein